MLQGEIRQIGNNLSDSSDTHIHHAGRGTAHQKLNIIPKDSVLTWALLFCYWTDSDDLCRVEELILSPCSSSTKGHFKWHFLFPKPSGWEIPLSAWEEPQHKGQGTGMGWGVWNNPTEAKVPPQRKPLPPSSCLNPGPATTQEHSTVVTQHLLRKLRMLLN